MAPKRHKELAGQDIYYSGWGGYKIPFAPQGPISKEEAEQRTSYYVGHYDADGNLVRFDKYLDGSLEWTDEYVYWDNGRIKERVMLKGDGSQTVQRFDEKGRMRE